MTHYSNQFSFNAEALPSILREVLSAFRTEHERNIILYSSMGVLSGLCTNVTGEYSRIPVTPNLYLMVLAPAASSKGTLLYAGRLVEKISAEVLHKSNELRQQFEQAQQGKKSERRTVPPFKVVLIPGDTSNAKLIIHLSDNGSDTPTILLESEIDTLTNAIGREYGGFSDLLRKNFHNEPIRYSRKTDNQFFEISRPKMAVVLSGTPQQLFGLIDNAENGLYSRFMIYHFSTGHEWSDVGPSKELVSLEEHFTHLAMETQTFYKFLQAKERIVQLSDEQWKLMNHFGESRLKDESKENGNADACIKRHALIAFKIAMLFTVLRAYEQSCEEKVLTCSSSDLQMALNLADFSLRHSLEVLTSLPTAKLQLPRIGKQGFFVQLPVEFLTADALEIAKGQVSKRTIERWLQDWVTKKVLAHDGHGKYTK